MILKQDLFKTDGFCRMNVAYQIRRTDQHPYRHQQGTHVQQYNPAQMKLHGHCIDIVRSRIQLNRFEKILNKTTRQSDDISPAHSPSDKENRKRQEYLTNGSVIGSQRFQHPICVRSRIIISNPEIMVKPATPVIRIRMTHTLVSSKSSHAKI